jgi:predicted component of type VI protein secretion system
LDKFRDYCRFEGKPFNEKDLYKKDAWVWQAYGKYQNYLRAKARNGGRDFKQRRN